MNPEKVIIDTDIGDDIDDLLALSLAVRSPELELAGVTTVFKNTRCKARIAKKLLRLAGRDQIPVVPGAGQPLHNRSFKPFFAECDYDEVPCQYTADMEKEAIADREEAADFILKKTGEGDLTLVAIGPLTNIARAIMKDPALAGRIKQVVIMGGAYFASIVEYNILCDPEAAKVVFESGIAIAAVGLDVTLKCRLTETDLQRIHGRGTALTEFLDQMITLWRGDTRNLPYLHDPLAVGTLINSGFVTFVPKAIGIETKGDYTRGMTFNITDSNWWSSAAIPANARVAQEVAGERFGAFFMERILA